MKRFVSKINGNLMLVTDSREQEYLEAGYKLASKESVAETVEEPAEANVEEAVEEPAETNIEKAVEETEVPEAKKGKKAKK